MIESDKKEFFALIAKVHAFYRHDFSDFAGGVWWAAMAPFDLAAVKKAINRHCVNPDAGQFMPKPADVVRMLKGGTQDQAALAWAKVDHAIRTVGTYVDVVFDDALIHRVIQEIGGWIWLGQQKEDDWPFIAKRFETIYRGYRMRSEAPEYPRLLTGISNAQNARNGFSQEEPKLIGNPVVAQRVLAGGSAEPLLRITNAADALKLGLEAA